MSRMTKRIEDEVLLKDQTSSHLHDESNQGSARGVVLKKGPCRCYFSGLCQEAWRGQLECCSEVYRPVSLWANHLRPNLKKGAFTAEEEQLIAELQAKMGNKWARIAAYLPSRTDNEIKNYWNTRIKRRQRTGLPLYPPEVCLQSMQERQQGHQSVGINCIERGNRHLMAKNNDEIQNVILNSQEFLCAQAS